MYFETRLLKIKEKNRLAVFSKKKNPTPFYSI